MTEANELFPAPSDDSEHGTEPEKAESVDGWDATMAELRKRFPKASDGILFCVHKLQQDRYLTIKDFRDEANLHGIPMSGRSLHSAKVLLGLGKPAVRRTKQAVEDDDYRGGWQLHPDAAQERGARPERPARPPRPTRRSGDHASVEDSLLSAVKRIQDEATHESQRLREAIRKAIDVLHKALDED